MCLFDKFKKTGWLNCCYIFKNASMRLQRIVVPREYWASKQNGNGVKISAKGNIFFWEGPLFLLTAWPAWPMTDSGRCLPRRAVHVSWLRLPPPHTGSPSLTPEADTAELQLSARSQPAITVSGEHHQLQQCCNNTRNKTQSALSPEWQKVVLSASQQCEQILIQ